MMAIASTVFTVITVAMLLGAFVAELRRQRQEKSQQRPAEMPQRPSMPRAA
jgi:heme/copper-type cytochrome/quinol oxidase subunit 2